MAKSFARHEAEKLCKLFPDANSRTLAKRLAVEACITIERARDFIRMVRGNIGKRARKIVEKNGDPSLFRQNGISGTVAKMPPSQAEPWAPFELGFNIKVAVLSDIHVPFHASEPLEAAIAYCVKRKPDILVLNGDYGDWYKISRFNKNPKRIGMVEELKAQREGLEYLRRRFKNTRIIFKAGNHDERWNHWLWNHAPEVCDLPELQLDQFLKMRDQEIEYVQDGRPIMAGKLPIFHGHELPSGWSAPVNIAKSVYNKTCDETLVGHNHRTSRHAETNWKHQEVETWSTGCLCDMSPEYARINKWNWGFAFVEVGEAQHTVTNLKIDQDYKIKLG